LARTFQATRLFSALTVAENLEVYASTIHLRGSRARQLVTELLEVSHCNRLISFWTNRRLDLTT
jgi:ABC-type branched-subunit amino acid transport system ATPase component